MDNGLLERMQKEAIDEIASGAKSWREVSPNTLILACFGLLTNHLTHKITKPLWWVAGSVGAGSVAVALEAWLGV